MKKFRSQYVGRGVFKPIAEFMTKAGTLLDNIKVYGAGHVTTDGRSINIYVDPGSADFSGTAYAPNGTPTTGLTSDSSKAWVKYVRNTMAFSEQTGPPSDPWPANEVWFEKANTSGNIVITL